MPRSGSHGLLFGQFRGGAKTRDAGCSNLALGSRAVSGEDVETAAVACLCYQALSQWHFGEIAASQAAIVEAMSLAKKLNDMHGLAVTLCYAAGLSFLKRNPAEVERLASDLIQ